MTTPKLHNILHIRDSAGIFGAERVILTLGKNIDPNCFNFHLLCLDRGDGKSHQLVKVCRQLGLQTMTVKVSGKLDMPAVSKIRNFILEKKIDLLHAHDFKANFYSWLASKGTKAKKILTAHGSTRDSFIKRVYLWVDEHWTYKRFDRIIAVSRDLESQLILKGISKQKIKVIQNGLDWDLITQMPTDSNESPPLELPKGKAIVAIVGRLYPDKGHRYFLEAMARVKQQNTAVAGLIVGDGPEKEQIKLKINELGLGKDVILAGVRNDMDFVYKNISMLIIPSLTEGLPYVLLEAMSSRVPVVATAVGDIPLLVKNGATGCLIPTANPKILADRMVYLLENPQIGHQMAEQAAIFVRKRFSSSAMVQATENLYLSLLNEP